MVEKRTAEKPDIREFVSSGKREPMLKKDEAVWVELPGKGNTCIGYRGPIPRRRAYGFIQFCQKREHFHRNEAGYAFSERALRKIRALGCQLVLIAETDTNMVWEFHESQFDEQVAKKNNPNHEQDPQQKVELVENQGKWPDHSHYVMLGEREAN